MKTLPFPPEPVLIVDDEPMIVKGFSLALRQGGIRNILSCTEPRDVLPLLTGQPVGVILLDLTLPHLPGEKLLSQIGEDYPEIPIIIVTGNDDVDTAVRCMKTNAFDYMLKPVEKSRLVSGVKRAIELNTLRKENKRLKAHMLTGRLEQPEAFEAIVTRDKAMLALFQYIESIRESSQPVLITGETGTGKELMARATHILSSRQGPFIAINVAGIDDNVFSDTLFGHVAGAFTDARSSRTGLVEKAAGGSLFLDEIGDLRLESQVKLLRLLQEQEFFPLGADVPRRADTRIIVATNQDLRELRESSRFRKDLYYRLSTHHIGLPPLRERRDDLALLVPHFLNEAADRLNKKTPAYPPELLTLLHNHHFPGNIRELELMIFDAVSNHGHKKLSLARFKKHMALEKAPANNAARRAADDADLWFSGHAPLPTLDMATQLLVLEAMRRADQNQSMAARLLGISRQRVARLLKVLAKETSGP